MHQNVLLVSQGLPWGCLHRRDLFGALPSSYLGFLLLSPRNLGTRMHEACNLHPISTGP